MNAVDKLNLAFDIFNEELKETISTISLQTQLARVIIEAKDKSRIFVRYNNHGEYAYSQIFSNQKMDRIRFDNYDEMWSVASSPNHFHPWQREDAIANPMIGDPEYDIPLFIKLIKGNVMRDPNFSGSPRFIGKKLQILDYQRYHWSIETGYMMRDIGMKIIYLILWIN